MPVSEYFKGSGSEVMSSMLKKYGPAKGERVFYATAEKKGMKPKDKKKSMKKSMPKSKMSK